MSAFRILKNQLKIDPGVKMLTILLHGFDKKQ